MEKRAIIWLKIGFMAGAVIDALAIIPMLVPWAAKTFWGFSGFTGIYYFAQGMGAALMLGWTLLLLWAYHKPMERRFIAPLTMVVILGIAASQITAIANGWMDLSKAAGPFVLQGIMLVIFSYGFYISQKATKR